jgi:hypothetical protein
VQASRIAEEFEGERPELRLRLEEDVTPELLRRIASHELTAANRRAGERRSSQPGRGIRPLELSTTR